MQVCQVCNAGVPDFTCAACESHLCDICYSENGAICSVANGNVTCVNHTYAISYVDIFAGYYLPKWRTMQCGCVWLPTRIYRCNLWISPMWHSRLPKWCHMFSSQSECNLHESHLCEICYYIFVGYYLPKWRTMQCRCLWLSTRIYRCNLWISPVWHSRLPKRCHMFSSQWRSQMHLSYRVYRQSMWNQ